MEMNPFLPQILGKNSSLRNLLELLKVVATEPQRFVHDRSLLEALASQGSLSRFTRDDLAIMGMALNTQKKLSNECVCGGYLHVNKQRLAALASLKAEIARDGTPKKSGTKAHLVDQVAALNEKVRRLEEDLGIVTYAFEHLRRAADSIVKGIDQPHTTAAWKRDLRAVHASFSLMHMIPKNVVHLRGK
jgi:hypothetical protein